MGKSSRAALTLEEKKEIAKYFREDPVHTQADARRFFSKKLNRALSKTVIFRIKKETEKFIPGASQKYRTRDGFFPEFENFLFKQLKECVKRGRITKTLVQVFANESKKEEGWSTDVQLADHNFSRRWCGRPRVYMYNAGFIRNS